MKKKIAKKEVKEVKKIEFKYPGKRMYRFFLELDSDNQILSTKVLVDGREYDLDYAFSMLGTGRVRRMIETEIERQTR